MNSINCPICGHENTFDAKVCASCGSALSVSSSPAMPISSSKGISTGGTQSGDGTVGITYSAHLGRGAQLQNGAFLLGDILGQGGFGITYKGGDKLLRRYVAIKEFFPEGCVREGNTVQPSGGLSPADYATIKEKFIEEASTLARFSAPGIVRVYSVFEENNTAYMVMEFLEGQTLSKRITEAASQGTTVGETEAIEIIVKAGAALKAVHEGDLIHRDLKPDNICLTKDGRVVLIDFGTARSFASGKTVRQTTMLTPGYAPLEQYGQQARFGAFTDIYALGATLYHVLTGQIPPQATDRIAGVELKSPREINSAISESTSDAVTWAMQIKADARPQSVNEFLSALQKKAAQPLVPRFSLLPDTETNDVVQPPATPQPTAQQSTGWNQASQPNPSVALTPPAVNVPPVIPVQNSNFATVQDAGNGQLLTNASAQDCLEAIRRAFLALGGQPPNVDSVGFAVYGVTVPSPGGYGENTVASVYQDPRGLTVGVSGTSNPQNLLRNIQIQLQQFPAASAPLSNSNYQQQQSYSPPQPSYQPAAPIASPYNAAQNTSIPNPYISPTPTYSPNQQYLESKGTNIMVMAVLGLFCCGILAPIAWVSANSALQYYGAGDPGDRSTVLSARIVAIIGTVLWSLWILISILGA